MSRNQHVRLVDAVERPLQLASDTEQQAEARLIRRVRAGDRRAFGMLVERYLARAFGVAMRVLRNQPDAEDVVQDAFLAALRHIDEFKADRPFWPWLARIVVNRSLDAQASLKVRAATELDPSIAGTDSSPYERAERSDFMEQFRTALTNLPPRRRLVIELFELEDLSVAEIASATGSSPATVRWHLHAGRHQLRQSLSQFATGSRASS